MGKLVVLTDGREFTVQNLVQLCVLVSSAHKTTRRDMKYTQQANYVGMILKQRHALMMFQHYKFMQMC